MEKFVIKEKQGKVGILTLKRPPQNAFNKDMFDQLVNTFKEFESDEEIGGIVITGGIRNCFSIGAELKDLFGDSMASHLIKDEYSTLWEIQKSYCHIAASPVPTIAAINGVTIGAGLELALVCDLRISSDVALFSLPEVQLSIIPGIGATQRLARLIGEGRAKEMLFLGRMIRADTALNWGLVNYVVPRKQVLDEAIKIARELAQKPKDAIRGLKQAINSGAHWRIEEDLKVETEIFVKLLKKKLNL